MKELKSVFLRTQASGHLWNHAYKNITHEIIREVRNGLMIDIIDITRNHICIKTHKHLVIK